jgi:hypothetical protein
VRFRGAQDGAAKAAQIATKPKLQQSSALNAVCDPSWTQLLSTKAYINFVGDVLN